MVCELDQLTDFTAGFRRWQINIQLLNSEADLFTASYEERLVTPAWTCFCSSWVLCPCGSVLLEAAGLPAVPMLPSFLQLPGSLLLFRGPAGCCRQQRKLCGTRQQRWTTSVDLLLLNLWGPSQALGVSGQEVQQQACCAHCWWRTRSWEWDTCNVLWEKSWSRRQIPIDLVWCLYFSHHKAWEQMSRFWCFFRINTFYSLP